MTHYHPWSDLSAVLFTALLLGGCATLDDLWPGHDDELELEPVTLPNLQPDPYTPARTAVEPGDDSPLATAPILTRTSTVSAASPRRRPTAPAETPVLLSTTRAPTPNPVRTAAHSVDPLLTALPEWGYYWQPERAPEGPVSILVSLAEQEAWVYRNGVAIARSQVSTGREGFETPTGEFEILEKNVDHVSNLYPDGDMPHMQRLTWDGIALHGGNVPDYPASHGCIRLPPAFAEKLYQITNFSDTQVLVVPELRFPSEQKQRVAVQQSARPIPTS